MRTEMDGNIRPWGRPMSEHDYDLAAIVLYQTAKTGSTDIIDDADKIDISTINPYPVKSQVAAPISSFSSRSIAQIQLDDITPTPYYGIFNNFALINVSESSQDILKLHVNFSEHWNLFLFGASPKLYSFSGYFLDSREFPYYQEFMVAYEKFLRGRKCVENEMEMIISYQGKVVPGYLTTVSVTSSANNPLLKEFTFQILVREEVWVRDNISSIRFNDGHVTHNYNEPRLNILSNKHRFPSTASAKYKG